MQTTCSLIKKVLYLVRFHSIDWENPFHAALIYKKVFRLRTGKTKDEREQKDRLVKNN